LAPCPRDANIRDVRRLSRRLRPVTSNDFDTCEPTACYRQCKKRRHSWIDVQGDDGMKLGKEEVAVRQLDSAIRLLFDGGDVVSVHTLACAAANVLRDILKAQGGEAWQDAIIESHRGIEREIYQILARAQNFFKHADRDPEAELDFDENTNDETIIVATLEYGELLRLGAPSGRAMVTTPMSVFQLWYFAKDPRVLLASSDDSGVQIVTAAKRLFPGLENIPRVEQLARGADVLRRREAAVAGRG
jgi:hypothetical protein